MSTLSIVEHLDVLEQIGSGFVGISISDADDAFSLEFRCPPNTGKTTFPKTFRDCGRSPRSIFIRANIRKVSNLPGWRWNKTRTIQNQLIQLGWRLAIIGKFEEGIPLVKEAIARSASAPGWYYHTIAVERLMHNGGEGMLYAAEKSTLTKSPLSYAMVAMAYGLLGNTDAAYQALEQMNTMRPNYDPIAVLRSHQATDEIFAAATNALHLAGWPGN